MTPKLYPKILPRRETAVLVKAAPLLKEFQMVLAGGTGLALWLGHRISHDLDFFTPKEFDPTRLFLRFKDIGLELTLEQESDAGLIVFLGGVKLSAFSYPYSFIEPMFFFKGAALAGLLDIAAMKIIAVSQRGKKRDFVDLYFTLQEIPFSKIAAVLILRYGRERINPVHIGKSLVYFADAELDPEPVYCSARRPSWSEIKKYLRAHVRQMVLDIHAALETQDSPQG